MCVPVTSVHAQASASVLLKATELQLDLRTLKIKDLSVGGSIDAPRNLLSTRKNNDLPVGQATTSYIPNVT